jgi:hypothetical protein
MARLTLIDQWKCLDTVCGHHWDTSVTYAQLEDAGTARAASSGSEAEGAP